MATRPHIQLDRKSSVPLYRQLAEELRYQIATGSLKVGDKLPPVAEAAKAWKVNLHTVRHAYKQLCDQGVADMRRARGTYVTAQKVGGTRSDGVIGFLEWVSSHGQAEFGLSREDIAGLLVANAPRGRTQKRLSFVECSEGQAAAHAKELTDVFGIDVEGWSLSREGEPPPGKFVSTYFHYNDIRGRWPHRMRDAVFVAIRPTPTLKRRLAKLARKDVPQPLVFVEEEEVMARSAAADVAATLPAGRYDIEPRHLAAPARLRLQEGTLYLFLPRIWAKLPDRMKEAANTFEIVYAIPPEEISRIALHIG